MSEHSSFWTHDEIRRATGKEKQPSLGSLDMVFGAHEQKDVFCQRLGTRIRLHSFSRPLTVLLILGPVLDTYCEDVYSTWHFRLWPLREPHIAIFFFFWTSDFGDDIHLYDSLLVRVSFCCCNRFVHVSTP